MLQLKSVEVNIFFTNRVKMKERIKQIRLKLGIQQGEFAEKLNVVQQQLSKYERGENKPSAEFLTVLNEKVNVNINWLLTGKGEMFINDNYTNNDNKSVEIKPLNYNFIESGENISGIFIDKNLINNIWHKDEKNLAVFKMPCDSPDSVYNDLVLKAGDIVVTDISCTKPEFPGIYAFFTKNIPGIRINMIQPLIDGSLRFSSPDKYSADLTYEKTQLERIGFKIVGKIIKNLSE